MECGVEEHSVEGVFEMRWISAIQVPANLQERALELVRERWSFKDIEIIQTSYATGGHINIAFTTPVCPGHMLQGLEELTRVGGWAKLECCDSDVSALDEYLTIEDGKVIRHRRIRPDREPSQRCPPAEPPRVDRSVRITTVASVQRGLVRRVFPVV
jgi:hypothetical protein